ncbi:hypothetical protein GC207_11520, partial [bacterium]|nr:hypothetical protein [bacterium]
MKTTSSSSTSAPTTTASSRSGRTSRPQQSPRQGLPSRPDHQLQQQTEAALPPIDLGKRRLHRGFGTQQVLALL